MGHFPENFPAGGGDAFDGGEGAIWVRGVIHGGVPGEVAVLGGDLAIFEECGDDFGGGEEFPLAV